MIKYDITTKELAKETINTLKKNSILDDDIVFILQHITANNDNCDGINKYGILNRMELMNNNDLMILKDLEDKKRNMLKGKLEDSNICAFFSAEDNLDYDLNLSMFPEMINAGKCITKKYDKYIITFKVNYNDIEKSGYFGDINNSNVIRKLIELAEQKISQTVKGKIVILNTKYNVPKEYIIKIDKIL